MSSIVLIGAGAILLLIGVGLGLWWGSHRRQQEAHKVTELEKELDDYRSQVTDHFRQKAEQFTALGKEYRKLYEHRDATEGGYDYRARGRQGRGCSACRLRSAGVG
jgi:uncharacterized membrane-anchored protein YhcB (DUF1043 family)